MDIAVELMITAVIVFEVQLFIKGFFARKNRPDWLHWTAYLVYGAGLFLLGRSWELAGVRLVFNTAAPVILALILYQAKLFPAIFAGLSASGSFILAEILMIGVLDLAGLDADTLMNWDGTQYVISIASHLLGLLLVLLILALTGKKRTAVTWPFLLSQLPCGLLGVWLGCEMGRLLILNQLQQPMPYVIAAIGLLYMNVLLVFYAERAKVSSEREKEQALAEQHYAMQERYYAQLREEQTETRALFHDIRKYVDAVKALVETGQPQEAGAVLEEVEHLEDRLGNTVDVGNPLISILLNEYREAAEAKGIDFDFDVSVPGELNVSASDLYILMGNTLDNAVDACCLLPEKERYIRLQLRLVRGMLFYCVKNPCAATPTVKEGKNHGYGLKSVEKCVKKYKGNMRISCSEGYFEFAAHLNL